ncbi:diguanylate cyclase [Planctobacterium marinum]|uniref:diguanylate cyclase n=1 Tax=Planctobacterium marinum TaxID=1631968 RepID=UPI001E3EDA81|nr:diguanylate cyclase [Planctobacterium marinum]MCC2605177.1 diguanylate cyclase [Planctobacterium marinum]
MKPGILLFLLLFYSVTEAAARADTIKVNKVVGEKEELILSILELALRKSGNTRNLAQLDTEIPVGRLVEETDAGRIDLMWAGSSKVLDDKLNAVRIPLLKGLLGHRIFIIRQGDQARFDSVTSLSSLSQFTAGMGHFWGSTRVLKEAGLKVETSVKYQNLFHMLDGGRFDYFPRAAHEPWSEVKSRPELGLQVEKNLLLIYPYAMYFYLRKDSVQLHASILNGLEQAITDGSFDSLFFANPMIKSAVEESHFSHRVVMRIANPDMHPDTPVGRPELWLDIAKL